MDAPRMAQIRCGDGGALGDRNAAQDRQAACACLNFEIGIMGEECVNRPSHAGECRAVIMQGNNATFGDAIGPLQIHSDIIVTMVAINENEIKHLP